MAGAALAYVCDQTFRVSAARPMTVKVMDATEQLTQELARTVKFIAVLLVVLVVGGGVYLYAHHTTRANAHTQDCLARLGGAPGNDCAPGTY